MQKVSVTPWRLTRLRRPPFVLVVVGRRRTGVKRWYMVKDILGSLPATNGIRVSQEELVAREKVLCTVSQRAAEVFSTWGG